MNKLTAKKCSALINDMQWEESGLSMKEELYLAALEIALPILEQQESDGDIFIVMRNPGKVPDIKRPVGDVADYLVQLYQHNPDAVCDVVTYRSSGISGQWVQDGREFLAMAGVVLEQQEKVCQKCDGSGAMDSGTEMWGDTVYVDCECVIDQQEKGNDGWIEWGGNVIPAGVRGKQVQVSYSDGTTESAYSGFLNWGNGAGKLVIAYRVIENDGREG